MLDSVGFLVVAYSFFGCIVYVVVHFTIGFGVTWSLDLACLGGHFPQVRSHYTQLLGIIEISWNLVELIFSHLVAYLCLFSASELWHGILSRFIICVVCCMVDGFECIE